MVELVLRQPDFTTAPPQKTAIFFDERFVPARHKEEDVVKKNIFIKSVCLACKRPSNDDDVGGGQRSTVFSGDNGRELVLKNQRFHLRKFGGGGEGPTTVERLAGRSFIRVGVRFFIASDFGEA